MGTSPVECTRLVSSDMGVAVLNWTLIGEDVPPDLDIELPTVCFLSIA